MTTTSEKLRKTNESILISEVRSLNMRVAEMLEQFSFLTIDISNVADELERLQVGHDFNKGQISDLKSEFEKQSLEIDWLQQQAQSVEDQIIDLESKHATAGFIDAPKEEEND